VNYFTDGTALLCGIFDSLNIRTTLLLVGPAPAPFVLSLGTPRKELMGLSLFYERASWVSTLTFYVTYGGF